MVFSGSAAVAGAEDVLVGAAAAAGAGAGVAWATGAAFAAGTWAALLLTGTGCGKR